jgi:hypothetical protein
MPVPDEELIRQFAEQGAPIVRARLLEWSGHTKVEAIAWLARQDNEERLRNEDSQSSQMRIALSARRAAWIAAIAAIIAAIAAIITIAVELVKK